MLVAILEKIKSMVVPMMETGERIKYLRNKKNWSLRELENRTGINYSVISRIESGKRPMTDLEINIFSNVFGVSSDYLLGRTDNQHDDLAAHRSDDPMSDLPDEARKEVENFMDYIRVKYRKTRREDNE